MRKSTFKGYQVVTNRIADTDNAVVVVTSPEGRLVNSYTFDLSNTTFTQARQRAEKFIAKHSRKVKTFRK